jgi:polyphosphate kinase
MPVAPAILPRSLTRLIRGSILGLALPGKTSSKSERKSSPDTYVDSASGKQRAKYGASGKLTEHYYVHELTALQEELVKLQYWVKAKSLKVAVVFEGRDAAGKGGVIKRIVERTNPRIINVVALGVPTERERSQWYFQRWSAHLPAGGEVALFDRSWYTRALTEHVMGFCDDDEYQEFLRSCPQFERMLIRSGVGVLKYWFSVSDEEQERRFQARAADPKRRWKLSPMDIESRGRWVDYSRAKDAMFEYTDTKDSPWYVVNADDKKRARLNCISHILQRIAYEDVLPPPIQLPPQAEHAGYIRPPLESQTFVPARF